MSVLMKLSTKELGFSGLAAKAEYPTLYFLLDRYQTGFHAVSSIGGANLKQAEMSFSSTLLMSLQCLETPLALVAS
jgi:hypothetical protein